MWSYGKYSWVCWIAISWYLLFMRCIPLIETVKNKLSFIWIGPWETREERWHKVNLFVIVWSRRLNSLRLCQVQSPISSRLALVRVRNKFRWLLVRESTPLTRLPMRRHEKEELKRQEDNPADGQYAFRSCVLSAGQIATPVKRPLFARDDLSLPSGRLVWTMHFVAFILTTLPYMGNVFSQWENPARFFTSRRKNRASDGYIFVFALGHLYFLWNSVLLFSRTRARA